MAWNDHAGTAADPYPISTWSEFTSAIRQDGKYIELQTNLQAPSESTSIEIIARQIDGKGFAINGLYCTGQYSQCVTAQCFSRSITIKNIKFTNVHMEAGRHFIFYDPGNYQTLALENLSISGIFVSGKLTNDGGGTYSNAIQINGLALNIEVHTPNFQLIDLPESWESTTGTAYNINAKIKYVGCSPSAKLFTTSNGRKTTQNCLFDIEIPTTGAKIDIGSSLYNCCIIGSGSGVIIDSASGVNVVENTIPPETELSNVHSLTTAQMKNAQYLHDLGFPIGVD